MLYLLNSSIVTAYGLYRFAPLDKAQAGALLNQEFTSAIGHAGTAEFLSYLLGRTIPLNRISIQMQTGDEAVIFRVKSRLAEGKVLTTEEMAEMEYEFSLLRRIE